MEGWTWFEFRRPQLLVESKRKYPHQVMSVEKAKVDDMTKLTRHNKKPTTNGLEE